MRCVENVAVELLDRVGEIGEHRELAVGGDFREAAEHDHALRLSVDGDRHDAGPQRRDERRMSGEHAEIALGARHVDLIDFAGEEELLGRDEIEVEGGHRSIQSLGRHPGRAEREPGSR